MEVETLERLKRVYKLAGIAPEPSLKRRKLGYNVRFIETELPEIAKSTNPSGYFSSHIQVPDSAPRVPKEQRFYRKRPKGIDFRLQNAIKTYKPPKPLPVKTVRFEEIPQIKTIETPKEPESKITQPKPDQKPFSASAGAISAPQTKTSIDPPGASTKASEKPAGSGFSFASTKSSSDEPKKFTFGATQDPPQANKEEPKKPFSFGSSSEPETTAGKRKGLPSSSNNEQTKPVFGASGDSATKPFSFGSSETAKSTEPETKKSFTFGSAAKSNEPESKKSFTFGSTGQESSESETKKPFSFGATDQKPSGPESKKPFSFGATSSADGSKPIFGASGATTASTNAPAFGNAAGSSAPFSFGAASSTTAGAASGLGTQAKHKFNDKPSFNFGGSGGSGGSGGISFGANSGAAPAFGANSGTAPAFGANSGAAPAFGANSGAASFGTNSTPSPAFGNNPLAGDTNHLAGGANPLAGGTNNGRKIAPLRRRIPR